MYLRLPVVRNGERHICRPILARNEQTPPRLQRNDLRWKVGGDGRLLCNYSTSSGYFKLIDQSVFPVSNLDDTVMDKRCGYSLSFVRLCSD